jgi:hypothetical protein
MDDQARATLARSTSVVFGYQKPTAINVGYGVYEPGTPPAGTTPVSTIITAAATPANWYLLHPHSIKDAVEVLASKNVPRLGETYVCFVHPHQSRRLRDTPEWIEVTKYAAPGNFMLGEIGRLDDVVFIETTQIKGPVGTDATGYTPANDPWPSIPGAAVVTPNPANPDWRGTALGAAGGDATFPDILTTQDNVAPGPDRGGINAAGIDDVVAVATPQWGEPWGPSTSAYEALMLGDNAFGHAISLPVELRDGGVLDFGREHALAWYSIWGWGVITDSSVVKIVTN